MSTMTVTFEVAEELSKGLAKGLLKFQSGVIKNVETGKYAYHVFPIKEIRSGILGITPQMAPAICIGVAIAAATGVICYHVNKAKTEIIKMLRDIHKDIKDIKNLQEAEFWSEIIDAIDSINNKIPLVSNSEEREKCVWQERPRLGKSMKKLEYYINEMLDNPDIWTPEWFAVLWRVIFCYIYVADAYLKGALELGQYDYAKNIVEDTVGNTKKFFGRLDQICQKDNEFMALGGLSKSQREEFAMLKDSVGVLENRKELVICMQEHEMVMNDIRELSKNANNKQEIMLMSA